MNEIANIIQELEQQQEAIDRALTALRDIGGTNAPTPLKKVGMQKRNLSPEGRARIAEAMRRTWAAKKKGNKRLAAGRSGGGSSDRRISRVGRSMCG